MRLVSLNCRGLNKQKKRKTIFKKCLNYDIICLQETYVTDINFKEWEADWPGKMFYVMGTNRSKGQMILLNRKLNFNTINVFHQSERILGIQVTHSEYDFYILNIYAPVKRSEKAPFMDELVKLCHDNDVLNKDFFICGDFNMLLNNDLDNNICGAAHDTQEINRFSEWKLQH